MDLYISKKQIAITEMKKTVMTFLITIVLMSCGNKNVKDWSDQEINDWFEKSEWNQLSIKPDANIDKRVFVEQNILNAEAWKVAYEFLKAGGFNQKDLGRYELDENGTYANIEEYTTKDSSHFEAHRKYIDIQYLAKGKEYIRVTPMDSTNQNTVQAYVAEKDIEFFDKADYTEHLLDGSNFMVLFPKDGHMPCMKVDTNEVVRKIVVKIPYIK